MNENEFYYDEWFIFDLVFEMEVCLLCIVFFDELVVVVFMFLVVLVFFKMFFKVNLDSFLDGVVFWLLLIFFCLCLDNKFSFFCNFII